jgi:hypothetical protein
MEEYLAFLVSRSTFGVGCAWGEKMSIDFLRPDADRVGTDDRDEDAIESFLPRGCRRLCVNGDFVSVFVPSMTAH